MKIYVKKDRILNFRLKFGSDSPGIEYADDYPHKRTIPDRISHHYYDYSSDLSAHYSQNALIDKGG